MNPKGRKLGTYGLEGIKGSPAKPPKVDIEFDTWLGMLNPTNMLYPSIVKQKGIRIKVL